MVKPTRSELIAMKDQIEQWLDENPEDLPGQVNELWNQYHTMRQSLHFANERLYAAIRARAQLERMGK